MYDTERLLKITLKETVNVLHDAIDYFGLCNEVISWRELPVIDGIISCPFTDEIPSDLCLFLWSYLVLLYGNYGTSTRFGWIERPSAFKKFIDIVFSEEVEQK